MCVVQRTRLVDVKLSWVDEDKLSGVLKYTKFKSNVGSWDGGDLSKCVEMVHGKREERPESLGMTLYLTLAIVGRVQTVDCEQWRKLSWCRGPGTHARASCRLLGVLEGVGK